MSTMPSFNYGFQDYTVNRIVLSFNCLNSNNKLQKCVILGGGNICRPFLRGLLFHRMSSDLLYEFYTNGNFIIYNICQIFVVVFFRGRGRFVRLQYQPWCQSAFMPQLQLHLSDPPPQCRKNQR